MTKGEGEAVEIVGCLLGGVESEGLLQLPQNPTQTTNHKPSLMHLVGVNVSLITVKHHCSSSKRSAFG